MSLRDDLLPVVDLGSSLAQQFGLSRFSVTLRRRIWSGTRVGEGTPTNSDIPISPPPSVTFRSPFAQQMSAIITSGGSIRDRYYDIKDITPRYVNADGSVGGFTPQQLRMRVSAEKPNVESIVLLIGDDGVARACTQVLLDDSDPFSYSMTVQETDRDSVAVVSVALQPNPGALARPATLQMVATATFEDGSPGDVSAVVAWTTSNPAVAVVDLLGVVTGTGAGTANIGCNIGGIVAPTVAITVT